MGNVSLKELEKLNKQDLRKQKIYRGEGLAKVNDAKALPAALAALATLDSASGAGKEQAAGRRAFLKNPRLENHRESLGKIAANEEQAGQARWANAALRNCAV